VQPVRALDNGLDDGINDFATVHGDSDGVAYFELPWGWVGLFRHGGIVVRNESLFCPSIVAAFAAGEITRMMKSVFLVALGVMNGRAVTTATRLSLDSSRHRWSLSRQSRRPAS
jgi:hypothetical protein